ncbi:hypothetical protein SDC9_80884 [bioreactor metagenome]|uniref:Zinc-ribbon domain-containing protein n=1 Tax=bioreactor metagenome TaxID=1076179 RepID=A0A644Z0P3_9ZZZZ
MTKLIGNNMVCPNCGELMNKKKCFCSHCGNTISQNNNSKLKYFSYFNAITSITTKKTNWLEFYVKIRIPLGMLFNLVSIIYLIWEIWLTPTDYAYLAVCLNLIFLILLIFTFIEMKNLTPKGYILNMILLFFDLPFSLLELNLYKISLESVFLVLNLIYFTKRKSLFYDRDLRKLAMEKLSNNENTLITPE